MYSHFVCSSYIFFMLFFRLPEKNMNENKSLFKIFSSLAARCCGRWRFFRALFMLLLKLVLVRRLLLVVLLLPLLTSTSTTTTVMLSTMLFFCCCCRWSDDDDGDDDDDQQEDDRDVVRRTSAVVALCLWCRRCATTTPVCVPRRVLFCMKMLPRRSPLDEISSICVSRSPLCLLCTLHGQLGEFFFTLLLVANSSYCHITHRYTATPMMYRTMILHHPTIHTKPCSSYRGRSSSPTLPVLPGASNNATFPEYIAEDTHSALLWLSGFRWKMRSRLTFLPENTLSLALPVLSRN